CGCKTSRATLKTDTKQEIRQTEVTDSSRTEKATTSNRTEAALSSSEQKNVVIAFEEWEYYPVPDDTTTGENYAHNSSNFIRTSKAKEDKPPNAGSVKKHRKGTITINADRQTEQNTTQTKETATDVQEASDTKKTTKQATKEKTASTEQNGKGKGYVWLIVGLLCAVFLAGIGIWFARRH
ncbi:MAG TPA: hypothetical protein VIQ97_04815, partial [Prevotella sp.]